MILRPKHFVVERREKKRENLFITFAVEGIINRENKKFPKTCFFLEVNMFISKF